MQDEDKSLEINRSLDHIRPSLRHLRRGWSLIRGSATNREDPTDVLEVEKYNSIIEALFDAHYEYNVFRDTHTRDSRVEVTQWMRCLCLLEMRQVGMLDAVRAVNMIGRPIAGTALLRATYETFLTILYICNETGNAMRDDVWDTSDRNLNIEAKAARFFAFGIVKHGDWLKKYGNADDTVPDHIREANLKFIQEAQINESQYKFGNSWSPFKSIYKLSKHLWPEGGNPTFSQRIIPISYTDWRQMYDICCDDASNAIHGNFQSYMFGELTDSGGKRRYTDRAFDPESLHWAWLLTMHSLNIIAEATGYEEIWTAMKARHNLIQAS